MSHFDESAADWDEQQGRREQAERAAAAVRVATSLDGVRDVLEVGAGTGLLSFALAEPTWRVTLADTSPGMLAVAQAKIAEAKVPWEAVEWDLSAADPGALTPRYDLVTSQLVLHHVRDVDRLLASVAALLRPDGQVVLIDLSLRGRGFHGHLAADERPGGEHAQYHHEGFDEATLRPLLASAGLELVAYAEPLLIPRDRDGEHVEAPAFVAVARRA